MTIIKNNDFIDFQALVGGDVISIPLDPKYEVMSEIEFINDDLIKKLKAGCVISVDENGYACLATTGKKPIGFLILNANLDIHSNLHSKGSLMLSVVRGACLAKTNFPDIDLKAGDVIKVGEDGKYAKGSEGDADAIGKVITSNSASDRTIKFYPTI